ARDLDLVLIDVTNPFGFDHVLPRGLLREPLEGLHRAGAFLLTRVDMASPERIESILATLKLHNSRAPIYLSRHALRSIADADGQNDGIEKFRGRKVWTFCGIGNPESFDRQLVDAGVTISGSTQF